MCVQAYRDLQRPWPVNGASHTGRRKIHSTVRRAVVDTGAQVNIVDAETIRAMDWTAGV